MKFCKDCKWSVKGVRGFDEYSKCLHTEAYKHDLVANTGRAYCEEERRNGKCGVEAKNFEPRPIKHSAICRIFCRP